MSGRLRKRTVKITLAPRNAAEVHGLLKAVDDALRAQTLEVIIAPLPSEGGGRQEVGRARNEGEVESRLPQELLETQAMASAATRLEQKASKEVPNLSQGNSESRVPVILSKRQRLVAFIRAMGKNGWEVTVRAVSAAVLDHYDPRS